MSRCGIEPSQAAFWTNQVRKSSLTPSHISFQNNNLPTTSVRRESLPLSLTILFCDFNFRSSLFRRLHHFSMFGFDSALPQPLESSQLPMISTLDSGMTD
jgi:hypothetical protein